MSADRFFVFVLQLTLGVHSFFQAMSQPTYVRVARKGNSVCVQSTEHRWSQDQAMEHACNVNDTDSSTLNSVENMCVTFGVAGGLTVNAVLSLPFPSNTQLPRHRQPILQVSHNLKLTPQIC